MLTLHKLPEGFIVTSEETPKGSDLIIWTGNTVEHFPKQGTPQIKYGCTVESVNYSGTTHKDWKKVIAQQDQIDFSSLSEKEQKEIGWFDVEKLAKEASKREISLLFGERINKGDIDEQVKIGGLTIVTSGESLYKEGFQKAQELLLDRRFTLEGMTEFGQFMIRQYALFRNHDDNFSERMLSEFLSQHKSWEIIIEMEEYGTISRDFKDINYRPKFTNGKIKILKIK